MMWVEDGRGACREGVEEDALGLFGDGGSGSWVNSWVDRTSAKPCSRLGL